MSELIVYPKSYVYDQLGNKPRGNLYYLKYEADKVIAELKDKVLSYKVLYQEKCRDINAQERFFALERAHQKYKRCLKTAELCELARIEAADYTIEKWDFYNKWYNRWLKIAEQFKEAK